MKLLCSDDELNKLVKHNVVEPINHSTFALNLKANLLGECMRIEIETNNNISYVDKTKEQVSDKTKSVDEIFNELRDVFPIDTLVPLGREGGRNLRSGRKDKILAHIKKHTETGYDLQSIINAAKYEVWYRVNASNSNENKLDFMQGLEAWLNNTDNIDAMIQRSLNSVEFTNTLANEGNGKETKSGRKVKLA